MSSGTQNNKKMYLPLLYILIPSLLAILFFSLIQKSNEKKIVSNLPLFNKKMLINLKTEINELKQEEIKRINIELLNYKKKILFLEEKLVLINSNSKKITIESVKEMAAIRISMEKLLVEVMSIKKSISDISN